MTEILLVTILVVAILIVFLQIVAFRRKVGIDLTPIQEALQSVERCYERIERSVRDEIAKNREEGSKESRQSREELANTLKAVGDTINQQLNRMRETVEQRLTHIQQESDKKMDVVRQDSQSAAKVLREEIGSTLKAFNETLVASTGEIGKLQEGRLNVFSERLGALTQTTEQKLDAQKTGIDERLKQIQSEAAENTKNVREEVGKSLKDFNDSVLKTLTGMSDSQNQQMGKLVESNQQKLDALKLAVEERLKLMQTDNSKQLDQMRSTVDEKLQGTLEKRLGESFKLVSERLEQVHKGLGEMQTLATGVGDLKKLFSNVKTRGTWGEVQLGALLEQVLSPDQYEANISPKENGERVEFAIKLPGRGEDKDEVVWLPIDAKFPVEDYRRLVEAQEKGELVPAEEAAAALDARIKQCAKDICDKYISPPKTTDFGILFLPTEGLFAEVLRREGLPEYVQSQCRVVIAGPTTLWSILNSLQMGFRTLAIQKRSSEVWNLLAAVKTEWTKYGEVLAKVQKKLHEASESVESAARRSRAIGRKLRDVQELPTHQAQPLLLLDSNIDGDGEREDLPGQGEQHTEGAADV